MNFVKQNACICSECNHAMILYDDYITCVNHQCKENLIKYNIPLVAITKYAKNTIDKK